MQDIQANRLGNLHTKENFNVQRPEVRELSPNEIFLNKTPPSQQNIPREGLLLVPIVFGLMPWMLFFIMRSHLWKTVHKKMTTLNALEQIPCAQCQFFNPNNYLQCAVHPATVLSRQAIDCPDYSPGERDLYK